MKLDPEIILNTLAKFSMPGNGVTRLPFTDEHRYALNYLQDLMQKIGLKTHVDAAGTLIGRREGLSPKTLLLGSHQDSVPHGGAFDGIMGIVLPICALSEIDHELPFSVEILAFADEEGVRFPTALMGPRALAGTYNMEWLEGRDKQGVSLREAMENFGLEPDAIPQLRRAPENTIAYIETHIEQGPVLEATNQPLGIVSAICGIERHQIVVTGEAGHAGTLPMDMRKDALLGAAKMIEAAGDIARNTEGLIATIGEIHNTPNAVNAVSGKVTFSLEIRSGDDHIRENGRGKILQAFAQIAEEQSLELSTCQNYAQTAAPCDQDLRALQKQVLPTAPELVSGATHDASAMSDLCPIGMFFVRCKGGVSHNPNEWADGGDLKHAVEAIKKLILNMQA